jgi:hypothetical protein
VRWGARRRWSGVSLYVLAVVALQWVLESSTEWSHSLWLTVLVLTSPTGWLAFAPIDALGFYVSGWTGGDHLGIARTPPAIAASLIAWGIAAVVNALLMRAAASAFGRHVRRASVGEPG